VIALGLALAPPPPAHARTFQCGAGDADCLIDSIKTANANGQTNTIRLAAGTYTLTEVDNTTSGPNGLPSITSTLTITGVGAATPIIEREMSAPLFRLLHVADTGRLTLNGMTLQGGFLRFTSFLLPVSESAGGGIANFGTLTLTDVTLTDNVAGSGGAGIYNGPSGTGTLTKCTLAHNSPHGTYGGGSGPGGGIYNDGALTLTHCALAHNTVIEASGGGIYNGGTLTLTNCTLARNLAESYVFGVSGGGIANFGTLTLTNCTLVDNAVSVGRGGGIDAGGSTTLQNTLLALNTAETPEGSSFSADCVGVVTSLGSNLIGNVSGCTIAPQSGDLIGIGDPGVGDFTDNGPPGTGYVPLLPSSPAIDTGNDAACPQKDQLGQPRMKIQGVGTSLCDIGAIEFQHRDNRPSTVAQATP
jgi:hypothetical protein